MILTLLIVSGGTATALLLAAGLLHILGVIGLRNLADWFTRAPGLDVWIFYFAVK